MTPLPPSPSEGTPLPPRHRPILGDLAKDTTEMDLWDFDDDMSMPDDPAPPRADVMRGGADIPAPRERKPLSVGKSAEAPPSRPQSAAEERIQMNVNKVRQTSRPAGEATGQSKPESDFDELDHWEDVPVVPDIGELPAEGVPVERLAETPNPLRIEPLPMDPEPAPPPRTAAAASKPSEDDEFSAPVALQVPPVSLLPHLKLTKIEKIGLVSLLVLLIGTATAAYMFSLRRLPRESDRAQANDFPLRGGLVTVTGAKSYWRAPITDGPDADTFRRGTQLLPVLEIQLTGGPAAIRVLFRNEDRGVVGDAVTRAVKPGANLKIAATAGFDDPGMHAAYRTGESKPWTIEVYEAPSEDSAGRDFKKVFEMNISTDLR